jgi:DNA-binding NtrC family response regulator
MEPYTALLVDDEKDFVSTLAERLSLRGVDTVVANDGFEAIDVLEDVKPAVVVLDIMMPGLGGLDVLARIKSDHPEMPVILLTGHGLTKDGIEGMRRGAFDYMVKPIKLEGLLEKMNEAVQAAGEESK